MADYSDGLVFDPMEESLLLIASPKPAQYFMEAGEVTPLTELTGFYPCDTSIGLEAPRIGGVHFYYPTQVGATDSVALDGQWYPVKPSAQFRQKILRASSGKRSIYDSGHTDYIYRLYLGNLVPEETRRRLFVLFHNICIGAKKNLQMQDETGKLYTIRLIDKNVGWAMEFWLKWNITLTFLVESVEC